MRDATKLDELLSSAQQGYAAFKDADAQELALLQAKCLIESDVTFDPAEFGLAEATLDSVEAMLAQTRRQRDEAGAQLTPFEEIAKRGLLSALQLLRLPQMARHLENSVQLQDDTEEMLWFLGQLSDLFDRVLQIRSDCAVMQRLCFCRDAYAGVESFTRKLDELSASIGANVNAIQEKTSSMRYPFPQGANTLFVGAYLKNKEFHPDPIEMALREGTSHFEQIIALYYRALAKLVSVAEQVEAIARSGVIVDGTPTVRLTS